MNPFSDYEKITCIEAIRKFQSASGIRLFFDTNDSLSSIIENCLSQVAAVTWMTQTSVISLGESANETIKTSYESDMLELSDIEKLLKRSPRTIRWMVSKGDFPKPIVNGRWSKESVDSWIGFRKSDSPEKDIEFYDTKQIEFLVSKTERTIRRMVNSGKFPAPVLPGKWLKKTVDAWFHKN